MGRIKYKLKQTRAFLLIVLIMVILICFLAEKHINPTELSENHIKAEAQKNKIDEKGYNLPITEAENKQIELDCNKVMALLRDIYERAEKGQAINAVMKEETILQMKEVLKENGYCVIGAEAYSVMEHYEKMEKFLLDCKKGTAGTAILYKINWDGGIVREKYIFDGLHMYLLSSKAAWEGSTPVVTYSSYSRIEEWKYTKKGWFGYQLCVPQPPEVTEIVDGSSLIRIKPMTKENREMSIKYVEGIGYQGNNLLCSNWDTKHMEKLDYNGLYEYFYQMKYHKIFYPKTNEGEIPKEEFETLMMEYLPITAKQLQEYGKFDAKKQTYPWAPLGGFSYAHTFFGTSLPEVTNIKGNQDGTVTLTVDAICDMVVCEEAVITHELTVRLEEDGSFKYLGNEILHNGIRDIPDYQYRINE